jgi:glycosyltransferase involved in cell wall biosynthesis
MPTITIITPTRRELHATYVMSLLQSFGGMAGKNNKTGYTLAFRTLAGKSNIHHARSIATSNWYDQAQKDDLMLFIDSDHTFSMEDVTAAIDKHKNTKADIVCGVYSNSAGTRPNIYPKKPKEFMEGKDDEVWYGGTGFMLISKPILDRLKIQLTEELGVERVWISDTEGERSVIPFFHSMFSPNELDPSKNITTWLGEDYSFCARVRKVGGTLRAFLSKTIGHDTSSIKYFFPDNYVNKTWDENTLVYYCGNSRAKFSPRSDSLGGSEQAVVELSKRFKRSGKWKDVFVFGNVIPGTYDGVVYKTLDEFDINNKFGDIILWRGFGNQILSQIKANRVFIDLHDNTDSRILPQELVNSKVEKVFVKSNFHATLFPQINKDKFVIVPNGVQVELFRAEKNQKKEPYRFCWTSSYDRNLYENLRFIWPKIKEAIPQAEFHIYYGDELLHEDLKKILSPLYSLPGVTHHGRAPLKKIATEKKRASFHLYVTDTNAEIDCISIRESAAAGCIPVITNKAVFSEREGFHIDINNVRNYDEMQKAADKIIEFVMDKKKVNELSEAIINSELIFGWDVVSDAWIRELK